MKAVAIGLLLVLALPLVSPVVNEPKEPAAWGQLGGGQERHFAMFDVPLPLDIIQVASIPDSGTYDPGSPGEPLNIPDYHGFSLQMWGSVPYIATPAGLFAQARNDETNICRDLRAPIETLQFEILNDWSCEAGGSYQAYLPPHDLLVHCGQAAAGEPFLRGIRASDGQEMWSHAIEDVIDIPTGTRWACGYIAWDSELDQLWVPIYELGTMLATAEASGYYQDLSFTAGHGAIALIAPEGDVMQSLVLDPRNYGVTNTAGPTVPLGVTVNNGDAVIMAYAAGVGRHVIVASADGQIRAWWLGQELYLGTDIPGRVEARTPNQGSSWAISVNKEAWAVVEGYLVGMDQPGGAPEKLVALPDSGDGTGQWITAFGTYGGMIYVGVDGLIGRYDTLAGAFTHVWSGSNEVVGLMPIAPDYLLGTTLGPNNIVTLDARTLEPRMMLPSSAAGGNLNIYMTLRHDQLAGQQGGLYGLPGRGEILVWNAWGQLERLGKAPEATLPEVVVSNHYPTKGERVQFQVVTDVPSTEFRVSWGGANVIPYGEATEMSYSFPEEELYEVWVTAIHEDGTTATRVVKIDVGGTPPANLNWAQKAAQPENYDLTFGVLGLLLALFGGLIAVARSRARRGRISTELDAIERAAQATAQNPAERSAAMNERRAHVRGLLLDGRIDESQLKILEDRIDELARGGRMEALHGRFDFLPYGFVRQVQEMLSDGRLSGWEYDQLGKVLASDDSLTTAQKKRVRGLLADWAKEDA